MSNFDFLSDEWPDIHAEALYVEKYARSDPRTACFYARRTLELSIHWIYEADADLELPRRVNGIGSLVYEANFRANLNEDLWLKIQTVMTLGNHAVHKRTRIRDADVQSIAQELFHFLYWLARSYTAHGPERYSDLVFDPAALGADAELAPRSQAALEQAEQKARAESDRRLRKLEERLARGELDEAIQSARTEVARLKKQNAGVPDHHDYNEAETRDRFIDLMLREAGWSLENPDDREFKVQGMPTESGNGKVDYVLWGDDGSPLGLVEAKRTKKDPKDGQRQAKLYADCLEERFGVRPIIFYTNGYETNLWDDAQYPPRRVQGFFNKDELALMIQRRATRRPLADETINSEIVERYYSHEAIRAVGEHFTNNHRSALLVMATGSGKTRTVVALVSLLQKANWVKRVLFLADRRELVKQATEAFVKFLPDSTTVNLLKNKEDDQSRVYVSTYQTMHGLIDERLDAGERRFGPGYFDLVIIDEAHRSVYQKHRSIFEYFDSLLVGLTATPRDEVDRNTYGLFDLEPGVPTYYYELNQAVADGFLVPPRSISVPLKIPGEGLKYADLSDEEKDHWESLDWEVDEESGDPPDEVQAPAVNQWFFNKDTVDIVLKYLFEKGMRVEGGDKLGKTIIFAKNKSHARFIQERFDANYPELKGGFAEVIVHGVSHVESAIQNFKTAGKNPFIAISVDMLDTGIDVPEIVNLVFFKTVRSKIKFFQMVGRGTRLREDLFGPGAHKEFFYIFDFCRNLEYFGEKPEESEGFLQDSLSKRLFLRRLELVLGLDALDDSVPAPAEDSESSGKSGESESAEGSGLSLNFRKSGDSGDSGDRIGDRKRLATLRQEHATSLKGEVASMNVDNFLVRPHRQFVEKFQDESAWLRISEKDYLELAAHVAGLPGERQREEEATKRFDLLMYQLQLAALNGDPAFTRLKTRARKIVSALEDASGVPGVAAQIELIQEMQSDAYWEGVTVSMLEQARRALRLLVPFIARKAANKVFADFKDELGEEREILLEEFSADEVSEYTRRVMAFLEDHIDNLALYKLKHNVQITNKDLEELERLLFESGDLGDREAFEQAFGKQEQLGVFIRRLIGLDRGAAKIAFSEHLDQGTYNAEQIRFVNRIVDYLMDNGVMEPDRLYEQPFTEAHASGLDGVFEDAAADAIVKCIDSVKAQATVGERGEPPTGAAEGAS